MKDILNDKDLELESRISSLIELVEDQPEEWYKLLIERFVTQEVLIEDLTKRIDELEKYENFRSVIIDSNLLETPTFLRDSYEVKATSNLLPDEGFYNKEASSAGFEYRWTKKDFYFEVPINRDVNKKIQLHLVSAIKPELLDDITCYANGSKVTLNKAVGVQGHVYDGILEKEDSTLRTTRLSFHIKTSFSPKELNPEVADTRELAVTFTKLTIN